MNKGLSQVINEVINWISEAMNFDTNNELILKMLKILNNHHSDLIQRAIIKAENIIEDSYLMSWSTIDCNEAENKNITK